MKIYGGVILRVAVISDIHANTTAFQAVLDDMESQRIDKIIFLGDLVANGPRPKESLEMMKKLKPLVWIKGNTDNWFKEIDSDFIPATEKEERLYSLYKYAKKILTKADIDLLLSKPDTELIEIDDVKVLCVHGSNRYNNEPIGYMRKSEELEAIVNEIEADILVCGHTHLPYYLSLNGKRIINVGSVSLSMDGEPKASYGIIDINKGDLSYENRKVFYNIKEVIEDCIKNGFPNVEDYERRLTRAR